MADDAALRMRRTRAHRSGNHEYCKARTCPDIVARVAVEVPGAFSLALETMVAGLGITDDDGRMVDVALVRSLAAQVDAGSVQAVRQVREILSGLSLVRQPTTADPPDSVDIAIAKRQERQADIRRRAAAGEFDRFGEEIDHAPWRLGSWGEPGVVSSPYDREHRQGRAEAIAALPPGTPCPGAYCGHLPMFRSPAQAVSYGWPPARGRLDFDHVLALRLGGAPDGPKRLTCSRCNRAAGQAITSAVLRAKLAAGVIAEWPGRPQPWRAKRRPVKRERW